MTGFGVLTATHDEAACWRRLDAPMAMLALASGADGGRARADAEALVARGVSGLLSFGCAPGLAPALRPGDLVIADSVVPPSGEAIRTDPAWRNDVLRRVSGAGVRAVMARMAGGERLPVSRREKRRAFEATFAAAQDTESLAVAEVAAGAGLPFIVVRAIADPAEDWRPPVVLATAHLSGARQGVAVAAHLLLRPWQMVATWRFAGYTRQALATLRRIALLIPEPRMPLERPHEPPPAPRLRSA